MNKKTIEQIRKEETVKEFKNVVKKVENIIGLYGHQPTLRSIRESYHNGELNDHQLDQVLKGLYDKTQGGEEPFKSAKHLYHTMFPKAKAVPKKELASVQDQLNVIGSIVAPKKKTKAKKKTKVKKQASIDVNMLPENLRDMVK